MHEDLRKNAQQIRLAPTNGDLKTTSVSLSRLRDKRSSRRVYLCVREPRELKRGYSYEQK